MSKWNSTEWKTLCSGQACPICLSGKPFGIVAELNATYLTSSPDSPMRGYCCLVLKRHAVELHDLSADEACRLMRDLQRVSKIVQEITGAVKLNYEIHGNTIPHLHVHLFPRYKGDAFEDGPINPRLIRESQYGEGEFESFRRTLQARLSGDYHGLEQDPILCASIQKNHLHGVTRRMQQTSPAEFHHPQGFLSLAKNVAIKDDTLDLTVIYSTVRARAAAMFTKNRFPGAPVIIGRKHVANGYVQALVINSKNANVAMGKKGIDNAIETCRIVGKELGISPYDVLPFSTGVIGRSLPMDKIRAGLRGIRDELKPDNLKLAAEAIMTTDKYPKYFSCRVGSAIIAGIAKGAGMIEPNMATMLVYLMTDAKLPGASLRPMLKRVVDRTFNAMSIDTDTSTSDTVVLMANGLAGPVNQREFEAGLLKVSEQLTRELARSGEGATKLITVDVTGAKNTAQGKRVAKSVVNSPLVKTAVYGCDPNWGRVIMAVGKTFDPSIESGKVTIRFGDTHVFKKGSPVDCDLEALRKYLGQSEVMISVDLGIGKAFARVWGCDLTEDYIKENAYYTT